MGELETRNRIKSIVAVIVVSVIVILAGFVAVFYIIPPRVIVITHDIGLAYSYGTPGHGDIQAWGNVYNSGDADARCTLNFIITDNRGWSLNYSGEIDRVEAGGFVYFSTQNYAWPETYNGISLHVGNVTNNTIIPSFTTFNLTASRA